MKRYILLLAGLLGSQIAAIAQNYSSLWQPVTGKVASKTEQALHPTRFKSFRANEQSLSTFLLGIPVDADHPATIDLPTPDGTFQSFLIWQTPMMAEGLAARYPGINTFTASAVNNPSVTAKIDYTQFGFHAMVFDGRNTYLVDPYGSEADGNYISYYKHDYPHPAGKVMSCEVQDAFSKGDGGERVSLTDNGLPLLANKSNGVTKHKYRLALACTGEYAMAVNGPTPTKAGVLAKMIISVNRVNGVYEREFSYTLELIANDDDVIYLTSSDPFTNGAGGTMLAENQQNMASVIGNANYDIGHVFSTGLAGIATKSSVCDGNSKAQGVTGQNNPVGDAFDIDFVAHEMGHQFGADHTFNYTAGGSCIGNGVAALAYEPGSGSTVMAYAGICGGGNDYQPHSSDNFHSASMEQISNYIAGTTCGITSVSTNTNAIVPNYTATYNIPYLTPFELIGPTATDLTADALTYIWEERDLGDFGKSLAQTKLKGPIFRPYPPTTSTTRVFPQIDSLLKGSYPNSGEKLPDTGRTLAFRYAERDIYQGFGCWNIPVDSIHLNVIYTGSPFRVLSPNGTSFGVGSTQLVTWNVGGTTNPPINCSNVDIFLSVDGGYNYPYTLAANTPNDGSEAVTIPNVTAGTMRIKVKGVGNVFFALNFPGTTAVKPVIPQPEVTVMPLPATDMLNIKVKNDTELLQAHIVNALGQLTWQGSFFETTSIPVNTWAKGFYYLQLTDRSGNLNMTRKVVLN